jgi:hypothetical protein
MRSRLAGWLLALTLSGPSTAWAQEFPAQKEGASGVDSSRTMQAVTKVPAGVLLVKGAWSSASDSVTPLPEDAKVTDHVFTDRYFGISYALRANWEEKYEGPPPTDSGRYALAQLTPTDTSPGRDRGSILITAQDMFFTALPAANAFGVVNYSKDNLRADYKVEIPPKKIEIAHRSFAFFGYWSPVAKLHWYVLATQIRCHTVQIVLTSHDTKVLESLMLNLNLKMTLPMEASLTSGDGGDATPVCLVDYARDENLIARVDPILTEHKFNPIPVRIIVDKEGKVKHIHFLSAYPEQAKIVSDALQQWKFKPYLRDGKPVEVETGIMFGQAPRH